MSNHWHFVVWPREDDELSKFFGYLGLTHAHRWQVAHNAVGMGHVYQSRFRNFMIQTDEHLEWVLRYVERNPLRANLVKRAQDWRSSSLHARANESDPQRAFLSDWPIAMPDDWTRRVNRPQTLAELEAIRGASKRGRPLGDETWVKQTARRHELMMTLRPRGRQKGWRKSRENGGIQK